MERKINEANKSNCFNWLLSQENKGIEGKVNQTLTIDDNKEEDFYESSELYYCDSKDYIAQLEKELKADEGSFKSGNLDNTTIPLFRLNTINEKLKFKILQAWIILFLEPIKIYIDMFKKEPWEMYETLFNDIKFEFDVDPNLGEERFKEACIVLQKDFPKITTFVLRSKEENQKLLQNGVKQSQRYPRYVKLIENNLRNRIYANFLNLQFYKLSQTNGIGNYELMKEIINTLMKDARLIKSEEDLKYLLELTSNIIVRNDLNKTFLHSIDLWSRENSLLNYALSIIPTKESFCDLTSGIIEYLLNVFPKHRIAVNDLYNCTLYEKVFDFISLIEKPYKDKFNEDLPYHKIIAINKNKKFEKFQKIYMKDYCFIYNAKFIEFSGVKEVIENVNRTKNHEISLCNELQFYVVMWKITKNVHFLDLINVVFVKFAKTHDSFNPIKNVLQEIIGHLPESYLINMLFFSDIFSSPRLFLTFTMKYFQPTSIANFITSQQDEAFKDLTYKDFITNLENIKCLQVLDILLNNFLLEASNFRLFIEKNPTKTIKLPYNLSSIQSQFFSFIEDDSLFKNLTTSKLGYLEQIALLKKIFDKWSKICLDIPATYTNSVVIVSDGEIKFKKYINFDYSLIAPIFIQFLPKIEEKAPEKLIESTFQHAVALFTHFASFPDFNIEKIAGFECSGGEPSGEAKSFPEALALFMIDMDENLYERITPKMLSYFLQNKCYVEIAKKFNAPCNLGICKLKFLFDFIQAGLNLNLPKENLNIIIRELIQTLQCTKENLVHGWLVMNGSRAHLRCYFVDNFPEMILDKAHMLNIPKDLDVKKAIMKYVPGSLNEQAAQQLELEASYSAEHSKVNISLGYEFDKFKDYMGSLKKNGISIISAMKYFLSLNPKFEEDLLVSFVDKIGVKKFAVFLIDNPHIHLKILQNPKLRHKNANVIQVMKYIYNKFSLNHDRTGIEKFIINKIYGSADLYNTYYNIFILNKNQYEAEHAEYIKILNQLYENKYDTISQIKSDEFFKSQSKPVYENVHDRDRDLRKNEVSFKNGNWYDIKKIVGHVIQCCSFVMHLRQDIANVAISKTLRKGLLGFEKAIRQIYGKGENEVIDMTLIELRKIKNELFGDTKKIKQPKNEKPGKQEESNLISQTKLEECPKKVNIVIDSLQNRVYCNSYININQTSHPTESSVIEILKRAAQVKTVLKIKINIDTISINNLQLLIEAISNNQYAKVKFETSEMGIYEYDREYILILLKKMQELTIKNKEEDIENIFFDAIQYVKCLLWEDSRSQSMLYNIYYNNAIEMDVSIFQEVDLIDMVLREALCVDVDVSKIIINKNQITYLTIGALIDIAEHNSKIIFQIEDIKYTQEHILFILSQIIDLREEQSNLKANTKDHLRVRNDIKWNDLDRVNYAINKKFTPSSVLENNNNSNTVTPYNNANKTEVKRI